MIEKKQSPFPISLNLRTSEYFRYSVREQRFPAVMRINLPYYNLDLIFVALSINSVGHVNIVLTKVIADIWGKVVRWGKKHKESDDQTFFKQTKFILGEIMANGKIITQTVFCKHPSQFTDRLPGSLCYDRMLTTFQMHSFSGLPPNKVVHSIWLNCWVVYNLSRHLTSCFSCPFRLPKS